MAFKEYLIGNAKGPQGIQGIQGEKGTLLKFHVVYDEAYTYTKDVNKIDFLSVDGIVYVPKNEQVTGSVPPGVDWDIAINKGMNGVGGNIYVDEQLATIGSNYFMKPTSITEGVLNIELVSFTPYDELVNNAFSSANAKISELQNNVNTLVASEASLTQEVDALTTKINELEALINAG